MQKTLRKALEELNKETPRLDYVRGMLEVLVEEEPEKEQVKASSGAFTGYTYKARVEPIKALEDDVTKDVGDVLDAMAAARLKDMPPIQME